LTTRMRLFLELNCCVGGVEFRRAGRRLDGMAGMVAVARAWALGRMGLFWREANRCLSPV
jgi:hypothetical protein